MFKILGETMESYTLEKVYTILELQFRSTSLTVYLFQKVIGQSIMKIQAPLTSHLKWNKYSSNTPEDFPKSKLWEK